MTAAQSPHTPVAPPSPMVRVRRLLCPGTNRLARGVDKTEATIVILFVLLALLLVPVMLTLGTVTSTSLAEQSAQQSRSRYETVAVLTRDAPEPGLSARGEVVHRSSWVPARWRLPDGTSATGSVKADNGLQAGAQVTVWLDESGRVTEPPLSRTDYVGAGVLVAVLGWLSVVGLLALACWALHHALDRRRYRAWDSEWARVEPDWHDRSR